MGKNLVYLRYNESLGSLEFREMKGVSFECRGTEWLAGVRLRLRCEWGVLRSFGVVNKLELFFLEGFFGSKCRERIGGGKRLL